MQNARWFLAHDKAVDDYDIDTWCLKLRDQLQQPEWEIEVTPGRDDYHARAAALGGWKAWCKDVPRGKRYDGSAIFHGVIVPARFEESSAQSSSAFPSVNVGRATAAIVQGFIDEGKHVFGWCCDTGEFKQVDCLSENDEDNWRSWAEVSFCP
mgnify:CR=1 FL=1|tara:strand:+ start:16486 stop:16944 length:459 start_codon:yes stop_codon:yes gene_type:complete